MSCSGDRLFSRDAHFGRRPGDFRPALGIADHIAHLIEKFRFGIIVFPATAAVELDEVIAATFGEIAPFLSEAIVGTPGVPKRHGKPWAGRENRDMLILAHPCMDATRE